MITAVLFIKPRCGNSLSVYGGYMDKDEEVCNHVLLNDSDSTL